MNLNFVKYPIFLMFTLGAVVSSQSVQDDECDYTQRVPTESLLYGHVPSRGASGHSWDNQEWQKGPGGQENEQMDRFREEKATSVLFLATEGGSICRGVSLSKNMEA